MGKENVKESVPRDLLVVQTYVPPTQFLGSPYSTHETICAIEIPEEIQEDERDMNDGCDITVEDIERLRKILTPSIHTLPNLEPIVQPYVLLGLVCNKAKVKREEEHDYDIPLQDHVMQPLTQYVLWKPSRDFTRPPGTPSGLKGLFHMLKCNYESHYERETRLFYRRFARSHLLQSSLEEESNAQGVFCFNSTLIS
ncbi:hypothetical protein Tco_0064899 [Tanacetum coccineum]